ncbi:hypothetical protein NL108_014939 [Boleophthalmus pectinirostris]|uniref:uncharacterized protein LOC129410615 n=1 Tax=Boleophthalmus pectinirostris TaxID=150288 RepID=UPI00243074C8|nr:uncharacterized protein LOC129410615 [Boleophthalmus pectinirostris]KAJ0050287.1 hypothetical protein NL108_014939 [Boleophthalmus pectinirostris]
MIGHLSCLFVILLYLSQTSGDDQITRTMLNPGDTFTMSCSVDRSEAGLLYFYKMSLESPVQTIADGSYEKTTFKENFNNARFGINQIKEAKENVYTFTIYNVRREDAATYVCQAGSSYKMSFVNTTLLIILDQGHHTFYVEQIPRASAPLEGPVHLSCSLVSKNYSPLECPSKRNVHWFKSGPEESAASFIYTYEEQTEEQSQRTCVYSLSTTIQDVNQTGTYYCAVAICGHVLFGPGTKVEINIYHVSGVVIILAVLLALCVFVIAVLICSRQEKD